jgi:hypothetical protein
MGSLGVSFDTASCNTETKKEVEDKKKESGFKDSGGGLTKTDGKTPKELWAGAKHGGFWFQVFSLSFGDEAWPRRLDKGVAIATSTGQLPKVNTQFGNFRVAQSEFYFDHQGEWDKVKDDVMWKMLWWRARLRRIDLSGFNLIEAGLDKLTGYLSKLGGAKLGKWLNGKSTLGALFGQTIYDEATEWLGDAIKSGAGKLGNPIIDNVLKNAAMPSWEIIH